jgi:sodium-coupled neutral amino acid transporter 11
MTLLGFVAWYAPVNEAVMKSGGYWEVITKDPLKPTVVMAMAILSDGFACQHAAFVFSTSLSNLSRKRWATVTKGGIGLVGVTFCAIAVLGCLAFQDNTKSDILNNFSSRGIFGNAARCLLAITMCFTYPLDCFVCRHVLTHIIYGIDSEIPENNTPDLLRTLRKVTVAVFILTMIPALILDDLGIVLALTGCLGASSIAYIAPGLIYLGLYGNDFLRIVSGFPKSGTNYKWDDNDTSENSYDCAKKNFMTSYIRTG